ncbi:MAG: Fic/DOC family N-terminal domain-containing protein, partial [Pseudomonadota bacterium]
IYLLFKYIQTMKIEIGKIIKQKQGFSAFIPNKFPPKEGFKFDSYILKKNEQATRLLGKLDGITKLLPDSNYFLLMYLRKDAASSSQIEGTQATMIEAIEAEASSSNNLASDVDDILNYIKALEYGMKRLSEENFPLSLRFIKELHQVLMQKGRSTHFSDPGEFRKSQNWIGGTNPQNASFVPPPLEDMLNSLDDLEKFIHSDDSNLTLIKSGLLHAQFETIHPFLYGNGRTGRMLITFYLWQEGFLEKPVLFLSSFFKKHQNIYYERLNNYHNGEVSKWLDFFLDGIIEISKEAIEIVNKITDLRENDMIKIQALGKRSSESSLLVLRNLYAQPIVNVALIQKWTGFTFAGAQNVIERFVEMGILIARNEDKKYGQSYSYKTYIDIFNKQ